MWSWELNANELLKIVKKSGLRAFLLSPTPKEVGRVVFTQLPSHQKEHPYAISDLGKLLYCAPAGKRVKLVGKKKGQQHEDGKEEEVFVLTYFKRRVPKSWSATSLRS